MPPYDIFFPITNIHMSWHRVINPYAIQVINGTLHRILILCFDISYTESLNRHSRNSNLSIQVYSDKLQGLTREHAL